MSSLRQRLRLIESIAPRAQLSGADFFVIGAIIGLASKVYSSYGKQNDQLPLSSQISPPQLANLDVEGPSLFKVGPHARELQAFINSLSQSDTVRAQPTSSTVLSALDDAALAIKEARGQELLSAEVLDARAQLVEALQSVLQETEGFTVEPVDPLLALTRLSDEEQPAPNESPGSVDSEQGDSLSATDPSSDELDGFDLDTDQGYEVASGIADLSIASVDPSSLGLGGFLPAGAVGGGGGGGGGVEGVFVADLPSAPAAPAGPSAPSGSPSFSSSPAATPTPTPTPTPPTPPASFGGRVVDGFVTGATVFYDANNNGILDDAESTSATVTDAAGNFTLGSFTATEIGKVVVLPGGFDTNTGQPVGMLQASAAEIGEDGKRAISSPLSLVLSMASDTISEADFVSQLGIVGVTSIDYYDPFTEMTAGDNPLLAEKVFTVQQQLFAVIQSATLIAGETAGIGALNLSVQTVAKVIADAVAAGELLTMNQISERAMGEIVTSSGYATDVSAYLSTLLEKTNDEIAKSYQGLANGLRAVKSLETSDLDREEAITLVSAAKSAAALSQDTLLTNVELALRSGFNADDATAAVGALVSGALSEKSAVFEQVLTVASSSTGPANTEFGNPGFLVSQAQAALQDDPGTASSRKDIVDLSSAVSSLTIKELQDLGVQHVRLLGSNQSVDLRLGSFNFTAPALSVDDNDTALDERFFAGNYSVTIRVTSSQITDIVVNAKAFADAGIDILRPEQGTLNISVSDARTLIDAGLFFSAGQVRIAADSSLDFDLVYRLLSSGLKFTDGSVLAVTIPSGDPRANFSTIQDLASKGVKFTGGEVQLEASDVVGSVASVQAKLLQAASAGLSFNRLVIDTDADGPLQEFDWKLGLSPRDGKALGSPVLSVTQATALADAGILFNSAKVSVSGSEALAQLTQNASQLFSAGVGQIELAASTEITIDAARALIDVRNAVAAGNTVPDKLFSGTGGVISNASLAATLGDLNELLAQGLSLPTNYQPTLSQVIDFVASGGSFPSGFVIPQTNNNDPVLDLETAQNLISAGVRFGLTPERGSLFSLTLNADGLNSSTVTGSDLGDATLFGRLATAGLGLNFTSGTSDLNLLRGTAQEPIILSRDFAAFLQSKGIAFDGVYLGVVSASEFNAVVTSVSNTPLTFTGISAVGIAPSVTPAFSQVETLLEAGISLIRVASTGAGTFSVSDAQVVMRVGTSELLSKITAPEATALSPQSMGQKGIDAIDVLGLDLSLSQALRFTDQTLSPPRLLNARLAITTAEDFSAAAAAAESLFAAGVSSIRLVSSGSFDAKVLASDAVKFVEAWSEVNPSVTVPRSLFNGGTLKGAGSFSDTNVQVGNLVASLVNAGLTRDANYQPSSTEILSYLNGGGTYSRPLLVTLQDEPTFSVDEARLMASRGVRFAGDQALSVSPLAESTQVTNQEKMTAYEALLNSGLKLSGTEPLSGVKLSAAQAKKLIDAGVTFTESTVTALNALELRQVGLDADALKIKGISSVELGSGVVPSFEQLFSLITKSISVLADGSSGFVVSVSNPRQIELDDFNVSDFISARVSALQFGGQSISMAGALKFLVDDKAIPNMEVRDAVLALSGTTEGSQDLEALLESTRASALYTAGFRKVDLSGLPALSAEDAFRLLNLGGDTSKDFQFVGGAVTKAALDPQTADQVISELKNAGLTISKDLVLAYDLDTRVTSNLGVTEQADARDFINLISKGFTLKLSDNPSDAERAEAVLSGVSLSLTDINTLRKSSVVDLVDVTVVATNQSQFNALFAAQDTVALSASVLSQLKADGVSSIGILPGVSPDFVNVKTLIGLGGVGLIRLTGSTDKYAPPADSADRAITLKVASATELSQISGADAVAIKGLGISRLDLIGLNVPLAQAQILANDFSFLGGTISLAASDTVSLKQLKELSVKGLSLPSSLPDGISLGSDPQPLDFVLNSYRGSLKGAVIDLTGVSSVTVPQVLGLIARGGTGAESLKFQMGTDPEALLTTPLTFVTTNVIQASQASAIRATGLIELSGQVNVVSALALTSAYAADKAFDFGSLSVMGSASLEQARSLDAAGIVLKDVTVDLGRAVVSLDLVESLVSDATAEKNIGAFTNGRLRVDSEVEGEDATAYAQLFFDKGLRSIELSSASPASPKALEAFLSAGFVQVASVGGVDSRVTSLEDDQVKVLAQVGAQITVSVNGQILGVAQADDEREGEFTFDLRPHALLIRQGENKVLSAYAEWTVSEGGVDVKKTSSVSFGPFSIDTVLPTLQIASDKTALKAGETATITFTFSEEPGSSFEWNGSNGDVVVEGGALSALEGEGLTRTAVFTPASNLASGSASITVGAGSYLDAAGNPGLVAVTPLITIDTVLPTLRIASDKTALKAGETATVTLDFTERPFVSGVEVLPAVTVSAGALGLFTQDATDPLVYTATFTPPVDEPGNSVTFEVDPSWTDKAGNSGVLSAPLPTIAVDTVAPSPANILLIDTDGGTLGDYLTNDPTPQILMKAEPGAQLKLYQQKDGQGDLLDPVEVSPSAYQWVEAESTDEQGLSTYTITVQDEPGLESGEYRVDVIDHAGNVSETSGGLNVFKVDRDVPELLSLDPANAGQTLGLRPTFSLTFNEQMRVGEGFIKLYQSNDQDNPVEIIDVLKSAVTLDAEGNSIIISLIEPLLKETEYFLLIDDGVLTDIAGNAFSGISESSKWSFTAKGATLFVDDPYDDLMVNLVESRKEFVVTGKISGDKEILDLLGTEDINLEITEASKEGDPSYFPVSLTLTAASLGLTEEGEVEWTIVIPGNTFKANTESLFDLRFSVSSQQLENGGIDEVVSKRLWVDTASPTISSVSVSPSEGQALSKDFHVELGLSALSTPEGFKSSKGPLLELYLDGEPLPNAFDFIQISEGQSLTGIATTGDLSAYFINPEHTLSVVVTDALGNPSSPSLVDVSQTFFFGPTFELETQDARANFSNLGFLAEEAGERSSLAIIDAGLGYVISDNAELNNLEIAESLGVMGSKGDDYMVARDQGSVLAGGSGNDTLLGGLSQDYLDGGDGNDIFVPLGAADVIRTGSGNDLIEISADAFYEQISRAQMEDLLLRVTQADQADVKAILDQFEAAQSALVGVGSTFANRLVGVVHDFNFKESEDDTDFDSVVFSGFSSTDSGGDIALEDGAGKLSYRFVKEFANPVGSEDPDYIFTSIMLSSDANAWTMAAVEEETPKI